MKTQVSFSNVHKWKSYISQKDLHAEHALALPGRCAPQTAGALIAQTVLAILEEREEQKERSEP